jgi:hypothetical protein
MTFSFPKHSFLMSFFNAFCRHRHRLSDDVENGNFAKAKRAVFVRRTGD